MQEEFFKIIGIIIFICILIYVVLKSIKYKSNLLEGIDSTTTTSDTISDFTTTNLGNIKSYKDKLESQYNTLKASMKINSTNKTEFDDAVIFMDDYVSAMMINTFLNMNPNNISDQAVTDVLTKLNVLNEGKKSLNTLLKCITIVSS
jgi:hypothetical protein